MKVDRKSKKSGKSEDVMRQNHQMLGFLVNPIQPVGYLRVNFEKFMNSVLINLKRLLGAGYFYEAHGIFIIFHMATKNVFS